jgi:hypothetical protein
MMQLVPNPSLLLMDIVRRLGARLGFPLAQLCRSYGATPAPEGAVATDMSFLENWTPIMGFMEENTRIAAASEDDESIAA